MARLYYPLPWPDYITLCHGQTILPSAMARLYCPLPWPDYIALCHGQTILPSAMARLYCPLPWPDYITLRDNTNTSVTLGQSHHGPLPKLRTPHRCALFGLPNNMLYTMAYGSTITLTVYGFET